MAILAWWLLINTNIVFLHINVVGSNVKEVIRFCVHYRNNSKISFYTEVHSTNLLLKMALQLSNLVIFSSIQSAITNHNIVLGKATLIIVTWYIKPQFRIESVKREILHLKKTTLIIMALYIIIISRMQHVKTILFHFKRQH